MYENDCFIRTSTHTLVVDTAYRPYDYLPPSTTKGQCTHIKANGRKVALQTKCYDFGTNVASCDADTDCTFIPNDLKLIKTDYACEETGNTDY